MEGTAQHVTAVRSTRVADAMVWWPGSRGEWTCPTSRPSAVSRVVEKTATTWEGFRRSSSIRSHKLRFWQVKSRGLGILTNKYSFFSNQSCCVRDMKKKIKICKETSHETVSETQLHVWKTEWQRDLFKGNRHCFVLFLWQNSGLVMPDLLIFFQRKVDCTWKRLTILAFYLFF